MSENSTNEFELVFQGPIDDSPDTLRKLKASFLADLEFEISDVQKVLDSAPTIILKTEDELQVKAICAKLKGAGALVSIVQATRKDTEKTEGIIDDEDEFAFEIAIDDLESDSPVKKTESTTVKTWNLDISNNGLPEETVSEGILHHADDEEIEKNSIKRLLDDTKGLSLSKENAQFEPSINIDEEKGVLDLGNETFDEDNLHDLIQEETSWLEEEEDSDTDIDSLIEQMKPELSPHPPSIPDIFLEEPGNKQALPPTKQDITSAPLILADETPATKQHPESKSEASESPSLKEEASAKSAKTEDPDDLSLTFSLEDPSEEEAPVFTPPPAEPTKEVKQEPQEKKTEKAQAEEFSLSLSFDDGAPEEEKIPAPAEKQESPKVATQTKETTTKSDLSLDSGEEKKSEGVERPKQEDSTQSSEADYSKNTSAQPGEGQKKQETPLAQQMRKKAKLHADGDSPATKEPNPDFNFDSPLTTQRIVAGDKKSSLVTYALGAGIALLVGVNLFLYFNKGDPTEAVNVVTKVKEINKDALEQLRKEKLAREAALKPAKEKFSGKYASKEMTLEANCFAEGTEMNCDFNFETPPPPELTPEEIVNNKVRAPWLLRIETLQVKMIQTQPNVWQAKTPARTYVEYKNLRRRIVTNATLAVSRSPQKQNEIVVGFKLETVKNPLLAKGKEVSIKAADNKTFRVYVNQELSLQKDLSFKP
jgi:hypothetical protein